MKLLIFTSLLVGVVSATVNPSLLKAIKASGVPQDVVIELPQVIWGVKSDPALLALEGGAKVAALVSTLKSQTGSMQAPFVAKIEELGLKYQQFWASNIILVKSLNIKGLEALSSIPGNFTIREQYTARIPSFKRGRHYSRAPSQFPAWNILMIRADLAWQVTNGTGSVIGTIDTGVALSHEALRDNFAGAWLDPVYNRSVPDDGHGHGTHVTGTACGTHGGIGVAPGAKWIHCRGMNNEGGATEADLTTCAEFMVTANPRPNVVSNSWGIGQETTWYNPQIQAWRAAGIIPVFAAGNTGDNCSTVISPGDQADLISVGASNRTDQLSWFSARGPSSVVQRLKPELTAPGEDILSADAIGGGYFEGSGTSAAAPHVAGAIAIILSAYPGWSYNQVFNRLTSHAAHPELTNGDRNCGLPSGETFPNYAWGWGRIDLNGTIN